ncbi:hypothetical protein AC579_745 [Pseudocercospora musae]|uniref:Zn(2)-C6 fungal-type domain-containing protein n=1 Tax=Pseudocercospora musae TaxID=113226 RepID=A0A139IJW4_9PEZI|nr:hypothetical protein AC579_745 [Pseudocercospora musae]
MEVEPRPFKRQKRRGVACSRCHSHKIKCSGEQPCASCNNAKVADTCSFPKRDRNVNIPESYIDKLEAEIRNLRAQLSSSPAETRRPDAVPRSPPNDHEDVHPGPDPHVPNPLLDTHHFPDNTFFTGEGACTAFADRLLECVDQSSDSPSSSTIPGHVTHPTFNRLHKHDFELPNRIQASLLIRRVDRFIGNNYMLFLKKMFFEQFDRAYNTTDQPDILWACQLFALLALGELYSNYNMPTADSTVPGTAFFIQAVSLLQDTYEVPSLEQVQILLLLSFYANSIGRLKSAHVYCGIALRVGIGLGLHRTQACYTSMSPTLREYRRRLFWTLYLFDRLISSKLGYPLAIHDEDIDVEMPSMNGLSAAEKEEFNDHLHLSAHVTLAKITGDILSDIYCLPRNSRVSFVRRVHRVLKDLRTWDAELPKPLRIQADGSARDLYTLHMHFHLCIIQTTRPILLHIFKMQLHPPSSTKSPGFSPVTLALADACTNAARTTNQLLSKLFVEGNLAMFGYFDAHYLFSSTLILIIATVMEPSAGSSDAVQMAFNLLKTMSSNGNITAKSYLSKLEHIRSTVSSTRAKTKMKQEVNASTSTRSGPAQQSNQHDFSAVSVDSGQSSDWSLSHTLFSGQAFNMEDPLNNPFIENFLDERAFEWPSGPSPQEDALRQFVYELGDDFVFAQADACSQSTCPHNS